MSKIGIIGAMELEVETLKAEMAVSGTAQKAGMEFYEGILNGAEGHAKIHIQIVAAVPGGSAGHLILIVPDKFVHFDHQRNNVGGGVVSRQQQIKAGAAAHGPEVDGLAPIYGMISKKSSRKMLDGM